MPRTRTPAGAARETVPVAREELEVGKRAVETARVRIRKLVRSREATVDERLLREEVDVQRVPVNRVIDAPVEPHYEGDVLVVPVMEERLVVEKRLVLAEELRVRVRRSERPHHERVVLRSEEPVVEREPVAGKPQHERK